MSGKLGPLEPWTDLMKPLEGIEVTMLVPSWGALHDALTDLCRMRALVCMSPNRTQRCDLPATRIFWQDRAEWYPCCPEHYPEGEMWTGSTRWDGGPVRFRLFAERFGGLQWPRKIKTELYDRAEAT